MRFPQFKSIIVACCLLAVTLVGYAVQMRRTHRLLHPVVLPPAPQVLVHTNPVVKQPLTTQSLLSQLRRNMLGAGNTNAFDAMLDLFTTNPAAMTVPKLQALIAANPPVLVVRPPKIGHPTTNLTFTVGIDTNNGTPGYLDTITVLQAATNYAWVRSNGLPAMQPTNWFDAASMHGQASNATIRILDWPQFAWFRWKWSGTNFG